MSEAAQEETARSRAATPPSSEVAPPLVSNAKGSRMLFYILAFSLLQNLQFGCTFAYLVTCGRSRRERALPPSALILHRLYFWL